MNLLVAYMPRALIDELDRYVQVLVSLAMSPDSGIRKLVCQSFVSLMQNVPERLQSNLQAVVRYMLDRNQDSDPDVALEACEFWSAFCEAELGPEFICVLQEFIPALVPVLLTNMAYEADDEDVLEAEEEERSGGRPESEQDLKPFTNRERVRWTARSQHPGCAHAAPAAQPSEHEAEEEEELGGRDGEFRSWNLRKSSASSLDTLSNCFASELLPVLLPIVDVRSACDPSLLSGQSLILHRRPGCARATGACASPPSWRSAPSRRAAMQGWRGWRLRSPRGCCPC